MNRFSWMQSLKSFFSIADAYHEPDLDIAEKIYQLGQIGIVSQKLRPEQPGQVEFRGTWWTAFCLDDLVILPGTRVRIIDRVELVLVVEPIATQQVQALRPKKRTEAVA